MFEKHLWKSDVLSKDAGRWQHGFYISGTLIKNCYTLWIKSEKKWLLICLYKLPNQNSQHLLIALPSFFLLSVVWYMPILSVVHVIFADSGLDPK